MYNDTKNSQSSSEQPNGSSSNQDSTTDKKYCFSLADISGNDVYPLKLCPGLHRFIITKQNVVDTLQEPVSRFSPEEEAAAIAAPEDVSEPSTDFYNWPEFLVGTVRSEEVVCELAKSSNLDPVLKNYEESDYEVAEPMDGERLFTNDELKWIIENRKKHNTIKFIKGVFQRKEGSTTVNYYGWQYNSSWMHGAEKITPTDFPEGSSPKTLDYAHKIIWNELFKEGGVSAINAYDGQKLSWGAGWAFADGLLFRMLNAIFTKSEYSEFQTYFKDHGIWYKSQNANSRGSFYVVNEKGSLESASSSISMIQARTDLLSVFANVGSVYYQKFADLQWKVFIAHAPASKAPDWAYQNWDDNYLCLVAHLIHGGWDWVSGLKGVNSISQFLEKYPHIRGRVTKSGAWVVDRNVLLVTWFQVFANGVAWSELSRVCPSARFSLSDFDSKDETNSSKYAGMVFYRGSNDKYYCYPRLPDGMLSDDETYEYVKSIYYLSMTDMIAKVHTLASKKINFHKENYSSRVIGEFGSKTRVVMDAALVVKGNKGKAGRQAVYDDPEYQILNKKQQEAIQKYMGDRITADTIWDYWDAGDYEGFFANVQGRSMTNLISTFSSRDIVMQIIEQYEMMGSPYGPRLLIALNAVRYRSGGFPALEKVNAYGLPDLPLDQRNTVRGILGLGPEDGTCQVESEWPEEEPVSEVGSDWPAEQMCMNEEADSGENFFPQDEICSENSGVSEEEIAEDTGWPDQTCSVESSATEGNSTEGSIWPQEESTSETEDTGWPDETCSEVASSQEQSSTNDSSLPQSETMSEEEGWF